MTIFLGYALTFAWVFIILGVTTILKKTHDMTDELSRKIVHIGVSFAWIPMYLCFGATWHLLVPPFFFVVLNYISYKKNIFSAMERSDDSKASLGTVYYPISMMVLSLLSIVDARFIIPYGVGMFCMAFGDGLAPIFGAADKGNIRFCGGRRSLYGSLSVFFACLAVIVVMAVVFALPYTWYEMLLLAVWAAGMEFVGMKGFDNLTLPIGTGVLAWIFICV